MAAPIVHSSEIVTLVGAAPLPEGLLDESLALGPVLVAADGGARQALALGRTPEAVIGDMDSIDADTRAAIPAARLHKIVEQDSTDFEKALWHIMAPLVLAVGFTGARLDHELAVYNALVRCATRPAIVIGEHDICFHAFGHIRLPSTPGMRVSLFPLARLQGESKGLRWPIEGIDFAPGGRVGTSNRATGETVELRMSGPGMLVILPRSAIRTAVGALIPD